MDLNDFQSPLGDETLNNENIEDILPSPSDEEVQTNDPQSKDASAIHTLATVTDIENLTSNDEYDYLKSLSSDEESSNYFISVENTPIEQANLDDSINNLYSKNEQPIYLNYNSNTINDNDNNYSQNTNSRRRENTSLKESRNFRSLVKYGEYVQCHTCNHEYDKNETFSYCENRKLRIIDMKYMCLGCAVKYVDDIFKLRDWEVDCTFAKKKCYRCNVKKSTKRYKSRGGLCAYCSLKKKYIYLRNKIH